MTTTTTAPLRLNFSTTEINALISAADLEYMNGAITADRFRITSRVLTGAMDLTPERIREYFPQLQRIVRHIIAMGCEDTVLAMSYADADALADKVEALVQQAQRPDRSTAGTATAVRNTVGSINLIVLPASGGVTGATLTDAEARDVIAALQAVIR